MTDAERFLANLEYLMAQPVPPQLLGPDTACGKWWRHCFRLIDTRTTPRRDAR